MIDSSVHYQDALGASSLSFWRVCSRSTQYKLQVEQDRQSWQREQPKCCMYCRENPRWPELQIHEIERKSQAPLSWASRSNYLLLCQSCHADVFATMPHAKQLALKYLCDPKHYNLSEWLRIKDPKGRAPNRVTQEEVDRYAQELLLLPVLAQSLSTVSQTVCSKSLVTNSHPTKRKDDE
jgi:hypothetical protein